MYYPIKGFYLIVPFSATRGLQIFKIFTPCGRMHTMEPDYGGMHAVESDSKVSCIPWSFLKIQISLQNWNRIRIFLPVCQGARWFESWKNRGRKSRDTLPLIHCFLCLLHCETLYEAEYLYWTYCTVCGRVHKK